MSLVEVVSDGHLSKWSVMPSNCDLLSSTKIKVFWSAFWMEGPMHLFIRHVTLPYHPLEIVELGVEHSGGRPRGGIGTAGGRSRGGSEARLMWIVCFDGQ